MTAPEFARQYLFGPLGITDVRWPIAPGGVAMGGYGIEMTPRDMAKFGYLNLKGDMWEGKQVVPAEWVGASATKHIRDEPDDLDYGYLWWIYPLGAYSAMGYAGQAIWVLPDLNIVVVLTAHLPESKTDPDWRRVLVEDYVIPAARSTQPLPENPPALERLKKAVKEVGQ